MLRQFMLPDSSKSLVSCCGYNMGMIKWTGNDLLTSKTIKKNIFQNLTGISCADCSRAMADKSTDRENDVVMAQFFFFTHVVSWQVSTKWMSITLNVMVKKNFHGNELTSKCSKLLNETTHPQLLVPLKSCTFWGHFYGWWG